MSFYANVVTTGFFNWTMTYRLDSDIPAVHGYMEDKSTPPRKTPPRNTDLIQWRDFDKRAFRRDLQGELRWLNQVVERKTGGLVAWLVSHCWTRSKREDFVQELTKHIRVKVFGGCTQVPCNAT